MARVKVVGEGFAFSQEFWGEDEVVDAKCLPSFNGVTHRHGRLDYYHCLRVDGDDIGDDRLDGPGVEVVGLGVVVGGGRDDDEVGVRVSFCFIKCGVEVEGLVGQEVLDLFVFDL